MDVDPCEGNFYEFACGGWTSKNPTSSPDNIEINQFTRMQETFRKEIQSTGLLYIFKLILNSRSYIKLSHFLHAAILENDISNGLELDAVDMAKQFYDSCLADNETEVDGSQEIRQLIDEMMLEFNNSTEDFIPLLSKIRSELDGNYIFNMWIDVHVEDNFENAVYVRNPF